MPRRQTTPEIPWWADDDPWRLSPPEEKALEESRRRWREAMEATPDEPPF